MAALALTMACTPGPGNPGPGAGPETPRERLTEAGRVYSPDDFRDAGVKIARRYDVAGLPGATAALNGFLDRREYEARFYPGFPEAASAGAAGAALVTGERAIVTGHNIPWEEGATDRRKCVGAINANCVAKYGDFIVYGNVVLLCEGRDSATSLDACFELVRLLPPR